ncbi:hypothetical protein [Klenkia brasiliensis]|uniref:hypothetical protein n=1 Tax=Klenkia brasiliensis TaxID=333142 RepID=UPI000D68B14E|nr:hypothetical protein [Klenkia brasiliensis]
MPLRLPTLLQGGVLALAVVLPGVLLAGPALAEPTATSTPTATPTATSEPTPSASAVVDPGRPTARLVHGPNCSDGFVRAEVTNGTEEHAVALTLDGAAQGAPQPLAPGAQVVLESAELAPGATADVAVAVTGTEGAEAPVQLGSWTRPTAEECATVGGPTGPTSGPTGSPAPTTGAPTSPSGTAPSTSSGPTTRPAPSAPTTTAPRPTTPSPTPSRPAPTTTPGAPSTSVPAPPPTVGGSSSTGQVAPGGVLTIRGTGFTPGEQVTLTLAGTTAPLATVTADDRGRVEAVVQIPQDAVLGPAVVRLVGGDSSSATEVALQVAARDVPGGTGRTPLPLMAAGLLLLALATALAVLAARRPRADDRQPPAGAAG